MQVNNQDWGSRAWSSHPDVDVRGEEEEKRMMMMKPGSLFLLLSWLLHLKVPQFLLHRLLHRLLLLLFSSCLTRLLALLPSNCMRCWRRHLIAFNLDSSPYELFGSLFLSFFFFFLNLLLLASHPRDQLYYSFALLFNLIHFIPSEESLMPQLSSSLVSDVARKS